MAAARPEVVVLSHYNQALQELAGKDHWGRPKQPISVSEVLTEIFFTEINPTGKRSSPGYGVSEQAAHEYLHGGNVDGASYTAVIKGVGSERFHQALGIPLPTPEQKIRFWQDQGWQSKLQPDTFWGAFDPSNPNASLQSDGRVRIEFKAPLLTDLLPKPERGPAGPQGPKGDPGPMGPIGARGDPGEDGTDGTDAPVSKFPAFAVLGVVAIGALVIGGMV